MNENNNFLCLNNNKNKSDVCKFKVLCYTFKSYAPLSVYHIINLSKKFFPLPICV